MGKGTKIGWADHTFNGWWGCEEVSPECADCYARIWALRLGFDLWGKDKPRRFFKDAHWNQPLKWNREAETEGRPHRVFSLSMGDWAEDRADLVEPRRRIFEMARRTPWLIWLLLTKREENVGTIGKFLPEDWGEGYPNVWLGVTAGDDTRARERVHELVETPARLHFLSYEPALGPVDWDSVPGYGRIGWHIIGGESGKIPGRAGPKKGVRYAREFAIEWARQAMACADNHEIPPFMKQLGSHPTLDGQRLHLVHKKGEDMAEWPEDLRRQELPALAFQTPLAA